MNKILAYDIETIPQDNLTDAQEEWLQRKIDRALLKNKAENEKELRRKFCATTPFLGKIITIGVGQVDSQDQIKTKALVGSEKEILEKFWQIIVKTPQQKNIQFVSFNGLDFDAPFILMRSAHHNVTPTNRDFTKLKRYTKYPHYDVMQWMANWSYGRPTLDVACTLAKVDSPKEGEVKADEVYDAYLRGEITKIANYCERDVRTTLELYRTIKNYVS